MNNRFTNFLKKASKIFDRTPPSTRGVGGAIARKDDSSVYGGYFKPILARSGVQKSFKDFTEEIFKSLSDDKIREIIKRSSPIVSKAVADYSDAIASGFTWTAERTLGQAPDVPQQQLIADFLSRLETEQGGIEELISEMARGMFTHGGIFTELVIDVDERTPVRLKVLDPSTARFRKNYDELIGEFYELGQDAGYRTIPGSMPTSVGAVNFVSFHEEPTIQYRAIQKEPNNPYGTPILDPAVFYVIMMAGFFEAFNDCLTGHVWPNVLINIDVEQFKKNAGGSTINPKELEKKLTDAIAEIQKNMQNLKPGGALIQDNSVSLGGLISGQNRAPLGSIRDVQDVIRRELILAVQSQPVLMGSNEAIAETHAIEQIKAYGKLIRRSQKAFNSLMTDYFNYILEINGYPRLAEFRLSYANTADYKDQAATYLQFREGLLKGSEDMIKLVEALDTAKASNYITEEHAMEIWAEEMELRRQINILPQDL